MRLLFRPHETGAFVEAPCRPQNALRPQHGLPIPGIAGEADALLDETAADAAPARMRLDYQEAQPGDAIASIDQHHRTSRRAVKLGNPAGFAGGVVAALEIRDDPGDQIRKL